MGPGADGIPGVLLWIAVAYLGASVVASPFVERAMESGTRPRGPKAIARAWQTEKIVGLAIRESAGLLGITVALLIGSPRWSILFGAATIVAMVMARPNRGELARRISGEA
jgi:F0F1-type ATP synthase membrane subunit c/vacuolar-type H+-ATPase subunit K